MTNTEFEKVDKTIFEEIKDLIDQYGDACIELGDYQTKLNRAKVQELYDTLMNAIAEQCIRK